MIRTGNAIGPGVKIIVYQFIIYIAGQAFTGPLT